MWQQADKGLRNCEAAPAFYGGLLYYPGFEYFVVVDPKDGTIVQSATASGILSSASVPYVDEDLIVIGSSDRGIFAFSRNDLTPLWNFRTHAAITYTVAYTKDDQQSVEASPIVINGVVYCGASDGYFYALEAKSGAFLWSYRAGAPILSAAVWHQGDLLFVDMGGNLYKVR
jgi:outer membrane protein assembly factor BamB